MKIKSVCTSGCQRLTIRQPLPKKESKLKLAAFEALKQAFPNQNIKIILGNVAAEGKQKIEVIGPTDEYPASPQIVIEFVRIYRETVCKKPRRVKIIQILLGNPSISLDDIKNIYNYPGRVGEDVISTSSLFQHLSVLIFLGYVLRNEGRPAKYRVAPQTEIIRKIAGAAKIHMAN